MGGTGGGSSQQWAGAVEGIGQIAARGAQSLVAGVKVSRSCLRDTAASCLQLSRRSAGLRLRIERS